MLGNGQKAQAPIAENNVENNTVNEIAKETEAEGGLVNAKVEVGTPAVKEFTISGKNFSFAPSTIIVQKGDKVKITFKNENGFHDFVIDGYGVATKQTQSPTMEVLEFTADKAGSFEYYCSVGSHRQMGMKGTFIVK